jgi:hypothetical protein
MRQVFEDGHFYRHIRRVVRQEEEVSNLLLAVANLMHPSSFIAVAERLMQGIPL